MSDQQTIGYTINDESLVCLACGYANKDAQLIQPAHAERYPDGFTCAECHEVKQSPSKETGLTMSNIQLKLDFSNARTDDPETSHKAGKSVKMRAGSQQAQLLIAYDCASLRGLTDEEAGQMTGLANLKSCGYWKRCSELRRAGYIVPTGETRSSQANEQQRVCVITLLGRNVAGKFVS